MTRPGSEAGMATNALACACLLLGATASSLMSQDSRPNLSGHWVMNATRSTLPKFRNQDAGEGGGVHIDTCCVPKAMTEDIDHRDPLLTIVLNEVDIDNQGREHPFASTSRMTTDNRADGNKRKSHWEFDQLVTVSGDEGAQLFKIRTLSSDGRTLTEDTYLGSREGKPAMTLVMERKAP
jgi:hypothetical protein